MRVKLICKTYFQEQLKLGLIAWVIVIFLKMNTLL